MEEEFIFIPGTESCHLQFQKEKTISIVICIEAEDTLKSVFRAPIFNLKEKQL